ncbi:hypothetical protein LWI28_027357 [Acer negundo]|uniref:Uncharacterized protein n=1 Tax=Acer negundo TaxID=4023 RepID=A0AAD5NZZ8_ACENE|nr:hypothetical protein LWI28_027357 [Acer negundo]
MSVEPRVAKQLNKIVSKRRTRGAGRHLEDKIHPVLVKGVAATVQRIILLIFDPLEDPHGLLWNVRVTPLLPVCLPHELINETVLPPLPYGVKCRFIHVGIPKLSTLSTRFGSSSILELEVLLGHNRGKTGVPASPSSAWVSYSTLSKTVSTSACIRPANSTLDKGKGILKIHKVPAPKEKKPPALSDEKVVNTFRHYCPNWSLAS